VRVDVVAEDAQGRPVTDLRPEELTLTDEGRREEIVAFTGPPDAPAPERARPLPRNTFTNRLSRLGVEGTSVIAILFDGLNTPMADREFARQQIVEFLRQVPPGSLMSLYTLGRGPRVLQDFTTDPEPLVRALEEYRGRPRAEVETTPLPTLDAGLQHLDAWLEELSLDLVQHYAEDRAFRTVRSLVAIANHLERIPGRKSLIWVSGSFPVRWIARDSGPLPRVPASSEAPLRSEIERGIRALASSNLAIYPVDARGVRAATEYAAERERISRQSRFADRTGFALMETLAERTGGRAFVNSNDLGRAFRRALADSRGTYTLGFQPSHDDWNGWFREIEVETTRPGVRLLHRRGYFAQPLPPEDEGYRSGVLGAARWDPLDATRLGLTVHVRPSSGGLLGLTLRVHAPDLSLLPTGDRWRGELDVWLVQLGSDDEPLEESSHVAELSLTPSDHQRVVRTKEIAVVESLFLEEDAALLRVLVRDVFGGALGSVSIPVDRIEGDGP
jgi:VWFA-related protein